MNVSPIPETPTARVGRSHPGVWGGPRRLQIRNQYDAATTGRRARGWTAPTVGPNAATLPNLSLLRARSRHAARNDPWGRQALRHRTAQMVGCGVNPRSLAPEEAFRAQVQTLWDRWSVECDADGRLDFGGLQTQAVQCWQEAGDVFTRLRRRLPSDGLSVPLQLQNLEPELCPHDYIGQRGSNRIRAGIELSPINQRVAYWMYREHPADGDFTVNASQLVSVPVEGVIQMYLPERPGQLRGAPHLASALLTMRDFDVGNDATLQRWMLGNLFVAALKRAATGPDSGVDPFTGQAIQRDSATDLPMVALQPGLTVELQPGEELEFNDPPEVGQTYEAFMRQTGRQLAAAVDVPYHALTGDMAQVNDRTIRVILQDFRRSLEALQHQVLVHQWCRPIWTTWFERAVLSGALTLPVPFQDRAPWMAVEWAPDRWAYINPVQDVEADKAEVRAGFASRTQKVKARGYDVAEIDRERAEDNAREDAMGLSSDSDPRKTSDAGLTQARPPGTALPDTAPADSSAGT